MKKLIALAFSFAILYSCSSSETNQPVQLKSYKDKLSYSLGADHARAISESGDPNYGKYNLDNIVKGFAFGLKEKDAFNSDCKNSLLALYGKNGKGFDSKHLEKGSECIGKLSGMIFQNSWKKHKAISKINLKLVIAGFYDGISKKDTIVKRQEQAMMIQNFMFDIYKLSGLEMIEKAKAKKGVQITPTGIVLETLKEGKGNNPTIEDEVLAHYILMNCYGDTLQNSYDMVEKYKQPLSPFPLNSVISGWQQGIPMMKKGGKYKLYLPFNEAYGEQGFYNPQTKSYDIPPFQSLIFQIEILDFGKKGSVKSL
jgi:FKBP-type peptidyl-prolyl cis-trans isomerase FkpA